MVSVVLNRSVIRGHLLLWRKLANTHVFLDGYGNVEHSFNQHTSLKHLLRTDTAQTLRTGNRITPIFQLHPLLLWKQVMSLFYSDPSVIATSITKAPINYLRWSGGASPEPGSCLLCDLIFCHPVSPTPPATLVSLLVLEYAN